MAPPITTTSTTTNNNTNRRTSATQKPYVRYDGNGRIVPSSLIYRRSKPLNGNWKLLVVIATTPS